MFKITPKALENLKSYLLENKVDSAIRVAIMGGGCSGSALGLALDKAGEGDKTFHEDTLEFLINKNLLSACGEVKVDFVEAGNSSGFSITSTNPIGGDCGGSCASGSCG